MGGTHFQSPPHSATESLKSVLIEIDLLVVVVVRVVVVSVFIAVQAFLCCFLYSDLKLCLKEGGWILRDKVTSCPEARARSRSETQSSIDSLLNSSSIPR